MQAILSPLFHYIPLIKALTTRHLAQRYRRSFLGYFWSILNPLFLMLIYALVFKYYMRFEVENYTVYLFCGLLPWIWTQTSLIEGASSIVSSGHLVTKSMFPAQILPTVSVLTNLINFILALPVLFVFMLFSNISLTTSLFYLPLVIFINFNFLLGISLMVSALNVKFRDVQHVVANILQFLFFLCPILYPITQVPERFHWTFKLNPFALCTDLYHQVILEGQAPDVKTLVFFTIFTVVSLFLGCYVFNSQKERFAEVL